MIKLTFWVYILILFITSVVIYFILKWRQNKPIFRNFQSSNIWKAFILNSIAASIIIFIALTVKQNFDTYDDKDDDTTKVASKTNVKSVFLTLSSTFVSSMLAYTLMYASFGFGGGMLVNNTQTS